MARKSLSHPTLPSLAITTGATTPNPGVVGALAWSTVHNAIVGWTGTVWTVGGGGLLPTLQSLNPQNAWRATNVTTSGGTTTAWTPVIGSVTLANVPGRVAQAQPAVDALLGNQLSVVFSSPNNSVATGYTGIIPAPGNNQSVFIVGRTIAETIDFYCLDKNVAGTGIQLFAYGGGIYNRIDAGPDVIIAKPFPYSFAIIATYSTTGQTLRINAKTPVSVANSFPSGFTNNYAWLGAGRGIGYFFQGAMAELAIFNRVLSAFDAESLMTEACRHYSLPLAA